MKAAFLISLVIVSAWCHAQSGDSVRITNVFTDADIRTALSEIAAAGRVTIIPDSSVKGIEVSLELQGDTVESALDKVSMFGGFVWKKKGDVYLVSTGLPDAPLFAEFAVTRLYSPKTQTAESLFALLARQFQGFAALDRNANLLSITGPPNMVDKVVTALEEVDSPRDQFVVEAMVTEIRRERGVDHGFSWSWKQFANAPNTGLVYSRASNADIAKVKALISSGAAEMRANPRVVAVAGKEALITVGNETYFPIVTGTSNLQNVSLQRISTGITLRLTGFVESGGALNLRLQPEVSDAVAQVNGAPTTTVRRADTYVRVASGETIVLGGLIVDTTHNKNSKLPILGDLPLIGGLFRSSTSSKSSTEVVILITPRCLGR